MQPIAMSTYLYTRADAEGKVVHQGIFTTFQSIPPKLTKLDDGSVIIVGGLEQNPNTPRDTLSEGEKLAGGQVGRNRMRPLRKSIPMRIPRRRLRLRQRRPRCRIGFGSGPGSIATPGPATPAPAMKPSPTMPNPVPELGPNPATGVPRLLRDRSPRAAGWHGRQAALGGTTTALCASRHARKVFGTSLLL